jgi:hypothetical protein
MSPKIATHPPSESIYLTPIGDTPSHQTNRYTKMKNNIESAIVLGLALGLPAMAVAGTEVPSTAAPAAPASNPGDWCEWLQSKPGIIYTNKENPFIQELQIEGRFQYQAAYLDGSDVRGNDFSESHDEYRRFRLGAKGKFLQYFGFKYQVNLVNDGRNSSGGGDLDWGYQDIDEAYLSFNLGKALGETGFDELSLIYGRQKYVFGTEAHTSSTKLLTIERSALANKVYGSYRPTGLTLAGATGPLSFATSLYSSTTDGADNEEFNGWQDSYSILANLGYQVNDELLLRMDASYNDANPRNGGEDSVIDYAWAVGFGAEYDAGIWGVNADVIYGDNGDSDLHANANRRDAFYGLQVTPYYWLIDKKVQLVGQYQYQGSEASEGVRINSRYGRADGTGNVNSGRGDEHHSLYAGLNYYICDHNAKIQAGIEYQTMETPIGDFDTLSYLVGFRAFF